MSRVSRSSNLDKSGKIYYLPEQDTLSCLQSHYLPATPYSTFLPSHSTRGVDTQPIQSTPSLETRLRRPILLLRSHAVAQGRCSVRLGHSGREALYADMVALLDKLETELGWVPVNETVAYTQDSATLKEQVRVLGEGWHSFRVNCDGCQPTCLHQIAYSLRRSRHPKSGAQRAPS
jgi:hypothetical protein